MVSPTKLVTPQDETSCSLHPLTCGSFLPLKYRSIPEEIEEPNSDSDSPTLIHLRSIGSTCPNRRLQFSEQAPPPQQPVKKECTENRKAGTDKTLNYVPPATREGKIVVTIVEGDLEKQSHYWKNSLIGFVVGDTPYQKSMENFVENIWKLVEKPQTLGHDTGYFIFRFNSAEDKDKVLLGGPYTFHNKPFIVQPWVIDFEFDPNCITTIPLWITLPGLPVGYWSGDALSKIASEIGPPLHTDHYTASMERISYAHVCVEVDATQSLIESIEMVTSTGTFHQPIEYD
ncbi:hypothetical protein P3S68_027449 [Capsicum galapagoense]